MNTPWIVARGDERFPAPDIATLKEWLAAGNLHPQDQVWNPDAQQWMSIRDLKKLIATAPAAIGSAVAGASADPIEAKPANPDGAARQSKRLSPGCRFAATGCAGMLLGALLTLVIEVWMAAAGIQAIASIMGGSATHSPSPVSGPTSAQYDLSQCGVTDSLSGSGPEDRDPGLREACNRAREEMRQREIHKRNVDRDANE